MQRVMGGSVGEVENEGLILVLILIKAVNRVGSKGIGMVEVLVRTGVAHNHLILDGPASHPGLPFTSRGPLPGSCLETRIEKVAAPVGEPEIAIKATGGREWLLVPFSGNEGTVSNGTQDLAEGGTMLHIVVTNRVGVVPGKQLRPGGVTLGGVVELCETQPALGQPVEVGSLDFPAIASDIRVTHVIDHDEDDVGPGPVRLCTRGEWAGYEAAEE